MSNEHSGADRSAFSSQPDQKFLAETGQFGCVLKLAKQPLTQRATNLVLPLTVQSPLWQVTNKDTCHSPWKLMADLAIDLGILFTRVTDQNETSFSQAFDECFDCGRFPLLSDQQHLPQKLISKPEITEVHCARRETAIGL